MVYTSTQALQNSLPNRSPSQRPRSLSLSEYQPLTFDREATALAYRAQLHQPSSTSSSTFGHSTSSQSHGHSSTTTVPSSLTHHLRRGDNPHTPLRASDSEPIDIPDGSGPFFAANNFAGVGAGHSLTPPQSPVHQAAQQAHRTSLNLSAGVSGSSLDHASQTPVPAPELPRRPSALPESTYPSDGYFPTAPRARQTSGSSGVHRARRPSWLSPDQDDGTSTVNGTGMGTVASSVQGHEQEMSADGWESDPGYPRYVGGRHGGRRELPAVPTNVPAPEPPGWEPDYKPQIPTQLTQGSVEHAYAQLSAPPPGLPPRRMPPRLYTIASASTVPNNGESSQYAQTPSAGGPSVTPIGETVPVASPPIVPPPPPGAPSFPIYPSTPTPAPPKPRRQAEESVILRADGRTPIWSTHYLDPCLRNNIINIPPQVASMTNMALSGLAKDSTAAAQMDGVARMAKGWFVPLDGKFSTDKGAIDLGLGVIDCGGREGELDWGREKGRRKARVEVYSRTGGIKLDLIELDENRQVDLKVETKAGDVLLLLPGNFIGSINITAPGPDPHFCSSIAAALTPIAHPYETVYTTSISPPSTSGAPAQANATARGLLGSGAKKQRWVPEFLRGQEGGDAAAAHVGEWSKVTIVTQGSKARIVLGFRNSPDEEEAKRMGVMVGMEGQEKKRRWWR